MAEKIVNKPSIKYDANGNMIYYKNSDGFEEWWDYDTNGNVIHHKDSNGTEYWNTQHVPFCDKLFSDSIYPPLSPT